MLVTKTIANQYPRGGIATFRKPVALTWRQRLGQAPNVEVVARDLFTTRNLLKSHVERNLLSPYSNIRAVTSKLCAGLKAWPEFCDMYARARVMGFYIILRARRLNW